MALRASFAPIFDMRRRSPPQHGASIDMTDQSNLYDDGSPRRYRGVAGSWRLFLLFASAIFLLLVLSMKGDSDASPTAAAKDGILTVVSQHQRPIVMATIWGYSSDGKCGKEIERNPENAIAKVALLSDQHENRGSGAFRQVDEPKLVGTLWETSFRLAIHPPFPFEEGDLCFEVHWRVEYADEESALSDFPSKRCSFLGSPRFHRPWNWHEWNIDHGEQWLVRESRDESWGADYLVAVNMLNEFRHPCSPSIRAPDYTVAIIGDSQPHYMCQHLLWELQKTNLEGKGKVRCSQIKQTLQNATTFHAYAEELQNATEDVVIFNPSGLWEAAYGSIDAFRENLRRLLEYIPTKTKDRQRHFFAPTTAVHPVNYKDLGRDERKWSMTQVRVRELNRIAKQMVMNEAKKRGGDESSLGILHTPIDALSLDREDDPKTPSDMRHFGNETITMLLKAIMCDLDRKNIVLG
ncbi:hypothetical protein ACHAXT_005721 [Thalassiosira profunda]